MDYCLDTSAINKLHDDPEREGIVARLLASNPVITTVLSIIETAITENVERRMSLLTLQRQLSNDDRYVSRPKFSSN